MTTFNTGSAGSNGANWVLFRQSLYVNPVVKFDTVSCVEGVGMSAFLKSTTVAPSSCIKTSPVGSGEALYALLGEARAMVDFDAESHVDRGFHRLAQGWTDLTPTRLTRPHHLPNVHLSPGAARRAPQNTNGSP